MKEKLKKIWVNLKNFLTQIGAAILSLFHKMERKRHDDVEVWVIETLYERIIIFLPKPQPKKMHIHNHNRSIMPGIVVIIIILLANQKGVFTEYQGIQDLVNILLDIINSIFGMTAEVLKSWLEYLNLPEIWEKLRSLL